MSHSASTPRWYAPWRVAASSDSASDPADQGTAFGLDMSMESFLPDEPARQAQQMPATRSGWGARLSLRRKAAGRSG